MRKVICLVLAAMMVIMSMPALAGKKPTEAQFIYRYTASLGLCKVGLDSDGMPETDAELTNGKRTTKFDNCLIMTDPESGFVEYAAIWFPEKEIDIFHACAFLIALNTSYDFEDEDDITHVDIAKTVGMIVGGFESEYCGYTMFYTKNNKTPFIVAGIKSE